MALYLELPVYKVCNELYVEFVKTRRTLPREERYTIGQELDRALVDTLVLIQRINSTRDKVPLIGRARQLVAEIQVRMRVLRDVRALSIRHFTELFDRSESLSRQLASWQKFSQKVGSRVPRDRAETISDADVSPVSGGRPESAGSRSGGARQQANPMRDGAALSASSDNGGPTATTEATS